MPGWDCHGLPIEWKIEEKYRAAKKIARTTSRSSSSAGNAATSPRIGSTCSARSSSASASIGDWDHPYTTMAYRRRGADRARDRQVPDERRALSSGAKPVMWSVVEQTALAEAEIEYHDHTSTTVWVRFPVATAVAAGARRRLGRDLDDDALDPAGQPRHRLWRGHRLSSCSRSRAPARVPQPGAAGRDSWWWRESRWAGARTAARFHGATWSMVSKGERSRRHGLPPSADGAGLRFRRAAATPAISSPTDDGTGFVHIAPGHGAGRFRAGSRSTASKCRETVAADGTYYPIGAALRRAARLLARTARTGDANERGDRRHPGGGRAAGAKPSSPIPIPIPGAPRRR